MNRGSLTSLRALAVASVGVRSALGDDARSTFESMRIGSARLEQCGFLRHRRTGAPITVGLAAGLDVRASVETRLRLLASGAAGDALKRAGDHLPAGGKIGVLLAMAHDRPGVDKRLRTQVAQALMREVGALAPVDPRHCRMFATGHDGGLVALSHAVEWLNSGSVAGCLVGGVESCVDLAFLDWLDVQERLKGEDRPFGVIPGEAAAFLLLVPAASVLRDDASGRAWVASTSWAAEPRPWYTRRPSLAEGLTKAIAGVFIRGTLRTLRAEVTYADLNGEPWRADEWAPAYVRTADNHGEPLHLRHPADCWGDVGAASAPLLACMAALEVVHPRMRSRSALVWTASDVGVGRGAALIIGEKGAH